MKTPRLVGVDYGTKRVGIALSDPLRLFAQPYGTFTPPEAERALQTIEREQGIDTLVVGWPINPQGSDETALALVQPFLNRLRKLFPNARIEKWDELFTSHMAEAAIRAGGARRKGRRDKARVDAAAAAIILQEYLDNQPHR